MPIYCLGLNHTTAPIGLREKLDFGEKASQAALARLDCGSGLDHIAEIIYLKFSKKQYPQEAIRGYLQRKRNVLLTTAIGTVIRKPRYVCARYAIPIAS